MRCCGASTAVALWAAHRLGVGRPGGFRCSGRGRRLGTRHCYPHWWLASHTHTGSDEEAMAHLLMYSTNYTVCRRALYAFAHALRGHLQHHVIGSWFHCRSSDRKLVPLPLLSLHDIPSSRRWPRHSQRRRAWWDAGFWIARILTALFVPVSLKARATQSYVD